MDLGSAGGAHLICDFVTIYAKTINTYNKAVMTTRSPSMET